MDMCRINGTSNNGETDSCDTDSTVHQAQLICTKLCLGNFDKDSSTVTDKLKPRSLSPPPLTLSVSESTDESDDCDSLTQNGCTITIQAPLSPTKSIILPSYDRRKSQSVKLTHIDLIDRSPKKAVRFADDFGLDLNQIKLIKTDELPLVPNEAFKHLQINDHENSSTSSEPIRTKIIYHMEPQFENPVHTLNFHYQLLQQKIILEQANAIDNRIYGTIKLLSHSLHKQVKIRLTTDNWLFSRDYNATYIDNSYDGTYDRFSFTIEIERHRICTGNNIQFCLCYNSIGGPEYWDNNNQQNYRFDCLSRTIPDYSI